MADSISSRVARIVAGNVHALLDAIENANPEAGLAQAIREVDSVIDEASVALGRVAANKHLAVTNLAERDRQQERLADEVSFAVELGRDDLAKAAIARQLDIEAQIPVLEQVVAKASVEEKELEGYVTALRAKKREMEEALRQFIASRAASPAIDGEGRAQADRLVRAGADFDRILARQTGVPGLAAPADGATAGKLRELADLARQNRIEERLAALKAKTNGQV